MLKSNGLSNNFWAEAIATTTYLQNILPTKAMHLKTSHEVWNERKPSVGHLTVFGCITYAHIPAKTRKKLDDKVVRCVMIGYSLESKGYRLYNPIKHELFVSRDVTFDDHSCVNTSVRVEDNKPKQVEVTWNEDPDLVEAPIVVETP